MWILTSYGAFMPALRPPETVAEGDPRVIQIRARRRKDLGRLRRLHLPDLGPTYSVPKSDYEFRANCTREALAEALRRLAMEIDYVSFKDTTVSKWGDEQLHDAYMSVWSALQFRLSRRRRRQPRRGGSIVSAHWSDGSPIESPLGNWDQS